MESRSRTDSGVSDYSAFYNNPILFSDILGSRPGDPPGTFRSFINRVNTYQNVVFIIFDHQVRALGNSTLGRAGGKTANQILASTVGLVNGKTSQQTFGILNRSAESLNINEEYRGWFNGGTLVGQSDPSSVSLVGGGGSSPSLAFASGSSSVVTQVANAVPVAIQVSTTLLANAVQGRSSSEENSDNGAKTLADFKEDLPNSFNGIDKTHLNAAIGDMNGKPIIDPRSGKVWDHLDDITGHMRSLNGKIRQLEKFINNGKFMESVLKEANTLRNNLQKQYDSYQAALTNAANETGTRINLKKSK